MIKEHPLYKSYAADDSGNIYNKSLHNKNTPNKDGWRLMGQVKHENGYYSVNIWFDGKIRQKSVHHIVYECYYQVMPKYNSRVSYGLTIDHKDGDKSNNSIENIHLIPHSENSRKANIRNKNAFGTKRSKKQIELMRINAKKQNQPRDTTGKFISL